MPIAILKKDLHTRGFPVEYTVLEIHFWSLKYTAVNRIRKYFEQLFIPIHAIQGDYSLEM